MDLEKYYPLKELFSFFPRFSHTKGTFTQRNYSFALAFWSLLLDIIRIISMDISFNIRDFVWYL